MSKLLEIIQKRKIGIREFAVLTDMPLYRVAQLLYEQSQLTNEEKAIIKDVFGEDIFLTHTKQNV